MDENKDIKDEIYKLYWEERLTQKEIGKIYGKSTWWVSDQMRKYKILTKDSVNIKTRFLRYVKIPNDLNDCWEWYGSKDEKGYGYFKFKGKMIRAHRVSYILHNGEFDSTLYCLHNCDNPGCVNPIHLYLGTQQDNMIDMTQKGRHRNAKGEKNGRSKLTEEEVKEIKTLLTLGISTIKIGNLFEVNPGNITKIKQGRIWKHIK